MFDKRVVKEKFSTASGAYNCYSGLQKRVAAEFADKIPVMNSTCEDVLDIGAGTGFLSSAIMKKEPSTSITALDIAHGMSTVFKSNNGDCGVVTGDAEFLPFSDGIFDRVVSSFSLQWVPGLEAATKEIYRVLNGDGKLLIAMPGNGSFPELRESHDRFFDKSSYLTLFNRLPCPEDVRDILTRRKFERVSVSRTVKTEEYKNSLFFLNTLKSIGAQNPFRKTGHGREYGKMRKMLSWYDSRFRMGAGVRVSYEILWIEGAK